MSHIHIFKLHNYINVHKNKLYLKEYHTHIYYLRLSNEQQQIHATQFLIIIVFKLNLDLKHLFPNFKEIGGHHITFCKISSDKKVTMF